MGSFPDKGVSERITGHAVPFIIFLAAFLIRSAFLLQLKASPFDPLILDGEYYYKWASGIAGGDLLGGGIYYGLPLYPHFLGLIFFIFGKNILAAQVINALLDSASCVLLYSIGKKLFGNVTGFLAAMMLAFYNMSLFFDANLDSTSLSVFLNLTTLAVVISLWERPAPLKWAITGLLAGITALSNASVLLFMLFFCVFSAASLKHESRKNVITGIAILFISAMSVFTVTAARNYAAGKDFVPVTCHSGITFYAGNNPGSIGSFYLPYELGRGVVNTRSASRNIAEKRTGKKLKPSEISSFWFSEGVRFIRENPRKYAVLLLKKLYLFWWGKEIPEGIPLSVVRKYSDVLNAPLISFSLIAPLACIGMFVFLPGSGGGKKILYIFIISSIASSLVYFVNSRYKMTASPVLILFSAAAVLFLLRNCAAKKYMVFIAGVAGSVFLFYFFNRDIASHREDVTFNQLGVSYAKNKKFDEAEKAFKKALSLNPAHPMAHYNLGTAYMQQGKTAAAVGEFKEAIRLNPGYVNAYNNLGTIYHRSGRYGEAIRYFEISMELDPHQENIKRALLDLKKSARE